MENHKDNVKGRVPIITKLKSRLLGPYGYLLLRAKALRLRLDEWMNGSNGDTLPLPPPLLRFRVHGHLESDSYLQVGQTCAENIKDLLGLIGKDLNSFSHILDFGCGSGRVLRYFYDRPASCQLYGTDIDRQAISWCKKHLDFASWNTNNSLPPTAYADHTFDFIFAISVFTHLDEEMQFAWLNELKRISKPNGILILTVHGDTARSHTSEKEKEMVSEQGLLYTVGQTGIFKADGLPDFYQLTHHSRAYVEDRWSKFFKILGYVEAGINAHQDAVILLHH